MAGGVKKPVNIFRLGDLGEPKGVFNWRLWFAVFSFGILGAARGVDEGLITGAFKSKDFQRLINFESYSESEQTNIKANVSAMVQIGCVGGALIAFTICDKLGRLWATRQLCMVWIIGIVIFMLNNGHLGAVYAGRFIAGIGIGQTAVVGPVYLAEIAPASVRGLCTCAFSGSVYLGIVLAYFANYGASLHMAEYSNARWLVPTSLHIMFATVALVLSFFQYESPRFLVENNQVDEATKVMARLRNLPVDDPYIIREISSIQHAYSLELEATKGVSWVGKLKELLLIPSNLYCLYLASMCQILAQWSGAGSITLYAPDFFSLLGITGSSESLLVTAVFGIVKFIAALVAALFLVEVIGRKRSLILGITLQALTMVYVAGFLTALPKLGQEGYEVPSAAIGASRGAIAAIYISGFGWVLGWNTMQYVLTAEIFPLRVRALGTSWVMTLHFVSQYGNSRAVPNMLQSVSEGGITPQGTFWCFAAVLLVSIAWVWFSVPETAGRDLESIHTLFELPWYKIGLAGNKHAAEQDIVRHEKEEAAQNLDGHAQYVETVPEKRDV
ncbi:quinate permease [Stachybotrys elegans]|uniref:Quinate permease n=1 Tax=Stachybotrys elegans TaxID=80388 RepID=A0A8K0SKT7_9HYPO|nr:quinate permease [Stachybotrys elegans]